MGREKRRPINSHNMVIGKAKRSNLQMNKTKSVCSNKYKLYEGTEMKKRFEYWLGDSEQDLYYKVRAGPCKSQTCNYVVTFCDHV